MAGEVEECITLKAENLPTGSISFGRFELESLSWERRSSFIHNRYLEEVEKYSTPGSVTKKKEYFEAHFKKKALLRQVPEENQNEAETRHAGSIIGDNDSIMEEFIGHDNSKPVEFTWEDGYSPTVPIKTEALELQKEEMSTTELSKLSTFINENLAEPFNKPLNLDVTLQNESGGSSVQLDDRGLWAIVEKQTLNENVNSKKQAENRDASSKILKTRKKNESVQMKTLNVSMKSTVEPKIGRLQSRAHLPAQQMPKKSNSSFVSSGTLKTFEKQNMPGEVEKRIISEVSAPSTRRLKVSRNMKAKASPAIKSEEGVNAKKVEVNPCEIDRRVSVVRQPVSSVKLVSKADDKQNSIVFNFKCSERAEKRKEYNLKVEKKLHAKVTQMNEIQAKTEVVKEAEIKQLRKSLNFKATPMPSFYHETPSKVSDVKKASTIASPPSNQDYEHSCDHTISPVSSSVDDCSTWKFSVKKPESSKGEEKRKKNASTNEGNGMERKGERKGRIRTGVRGIVSGNVAVHVAS